jgi:hypothetical protein
VGASGRSLFENIAGIKNSRKLFVSLPRPELFRSLRIELNVFAIFFGLFSWQKPCDFRWMHLLGSDERIVIFTCQLKNVFFSVHPGCGTWSWKAETK